MSADRRRVRAWLCRCVLGGLVVGLTPVGVVSAAPPLCFGKVPTIVGTARDDVLVGTPGSDVIVGLDGMDDISGRGGDDRICGGDNKFIEGGEHESSVYETLRGEAGNDFIAGQNGMDALEGGFGDDQLLLGPNPLMEHWCCGFYPELAYGGPGDDLLSTGGGSDELSGGDGNDRLFAGSGEASLLGDAGDDVLVGGDGDTSLEGGVGDDLGFAGADGVFWDGRSQAAGDVDRFYGGPGNDYLAEGGKGRLIARGAGGNDRLAGGNQNDILIGGSGDDELVGYGGDDQLRGGPGRDRVDFNLTESNETNEHENRMRVDLERGRAAGRGRDTLSSIEDVLGGAGDDVLLGSRVDNTFYILDPISSETGRDIIDGRGGRDRVEALGEQGMWADLMKGTVEVDQGRGRAQLTSIEDLTGTINGRDVLRGDSGPNTIRGVRLISFGNQHKDDIIIGRGGDDRLFGSPGRDRIFGGPGRDLLSGGPGRDRLSGGPGNDRLHGGRGADVNNGGSGRDRCLSPARGPSTRSCE